MAARHYKSNIPVDWKSWITQCITHLRKMIARFYETALCLGTSITHHISPQDMDKHFGMGFLPDTWNCGLRMRRECQERFPRHPRVSDPDMHHGTCVTHVPWCIPVSLTSGFLWSRWQGKRSQHSRRMRNPQFYISGKRIMVQSLDKRY